MGCVKTILNSRAASGVQAGRPSLPISFSFGRGNLWANEEVKGIVINQEETAKLSQYADDTTAALYSLI